MGLLMADGGSNSFDSVLNICSGSCMVGYVFTLKCFRKNYHIVFFYFIFAICSISPQFLCSHWTLYLFLAEIRNLLMIVSFCQKSSPPGAVGTSIALETILLHSSVDNKSHRWWSFLVWIHCCCWLFLFNASTECGIISMTWTEMK